MKLSVIIPVYNVSIELLDKCFNSLHSQTIKDCEFIVVDDGSEHEVALFCDKFQKNDSRVRVIHQNNMGLAGARNTGIKLAYGEYLIFIDSDDWIPRDEVFDKVCEYTDFHQLDLLFFQNATQLSEQFNNEANSLDIKTIQKYIIRQDETINGFVLGSAWAKVFRMKFLKDCNLQFDIKLRRTQDRIFMLNYLQNNPKFEFLEFVGYYFNVENGNSLSKKYNPHTINYLNLVELECNNFVNQYHKNDLEFEEALIELKFKLFFESIWLDCCNKNNKKDFLVRYKSFTKLINLFFDDKLLFDKFYDSQRIKKAVIIFLKNNKSWMAFLLLEFYKASTPIILKIKKLNRYK